MRPDRQDAIVRFLPKAQLAIHALMNEPATLHDYARLGFPVRLMRGEHAPSPTILIAEQLATRFPNADLVTIAGAGHMGPLTHAGLVAHAVAAHIRLVDAESRARAA